MRIINTLLVLVGLFSIYGLVSYWDNQSASQGRRYDCNMAEWHPDIPVEVREACRQLRQKREAK